MGRIDLSNQPRHGEADESQIKTSEARVEELSVVRVDRGMQSRQVGLRSVMKARMLTLSFLTVASPCSCIAGFCNQRDPTDVAYSMPVSPTGFRPLQLLLNIREIALCCGSIAYCFGKTKVLICV